MSNIDSLAGKVYQHVLKGGREPEALPGSGIRYKDLPGGISVIAEPTTLPTIDKNNQIQLDRLRVTGPSKHGADLLTEEISMPLKK